MRQFLRTKTFIVACVCAVLLGLYALAGFVLAPKLVRSALLKDIPAAIGAVPAVGEIHINPFLFKVSVDNFSLSDPAGVRLLGFERLFVDFQVSSIWHRAYSFVNIDLTAPFVNVAVGETGALNLLQLIPKDKKKADPATADSALPALRIESLKVARGLVNYEDHSHPDVFAARLEPINFSLSNFTTGVDGGQFSLSGTSKLGERIEFHGQMSVEPVQSVGEFRIEGLLAHTLWSYLEDQLNFVVNSGTINLNATYRFELHDAVNQGPALQLDMPKATLTDFTLRPKQGETDWLTLPELVLSGTTVHLVRREAHVDSLSLSGLKVSTWLEPDGTLNFQQLLQPPAAPAAAAPGTAPAGATSGAGLPSVAVVSPPAAAGGAAVPPAKPWKFDLGEFQIHDAHLAVEDRGTKPVAKFSVDPLTVNVSGISLDLGKPVKVEFDARVNESGAVSANGNVTPQPLSADLDVKVKDLGLPAIQPYLAQHTSMTLMNGLLGVDAKVHYAVAGGTPADASPAKKPSVSVVGDVNVQKFRTVDNDLRDDFLNWERLDLTGIRFSQVPDRLDVAQVTARRLYARVIIEKDSSLNVTRILTAPGAAKTPTGSANETPKTAKVKAGNSKAAAAAAAPGMPMAIKKILVQDGRVNFTDLSVQPNFSAGIQSLEGSILGLSSQSGSRANVDLKGSVEQFAPVSILGQVNVLSAALYTDIGMNFRNIELSVFNPYSGKFAGYNISKGKLSTELHYKVDGRKLDATHHIVVDQLEFGDKTASKDAVSLPIKLAVALLKDRNGVIDLNFPVTGSLDDPQFRLAPIIWKVFVNILEKAVTAPFALLGSLFGGGPDLNYIEFQPGVATLDAQAADKVRTIAKALIERPQLKLEVPIATVADVDGPALVAQAYRTKVSEAQAAQPTRKKAASAATPATAVPFEQLDPAAQLDLLSGVYNRELGSEPAYPPEIAALKTKPELTAAKLEFLGKAIREHLVVGDNELQALGQQRAVALQQILLADPQVVAERVFLVANAKASEKDGAVRLELSLQ